MTYVIGDLKVEEIIGTFYEKDLQERSLAKLRIEKKKWGKKVKNSLSNGRAIIIHSIAGLIWKI